MGNTGEFELIALLAVARLGENAYGVTIRDTLEARTSRVVSLGSVYKSLGRLESRGLVQSSILPPTQERGGRRKKAYRLTPEGVSSVRSALSDLRELADGLQLGLETP